MLATISKWGNGHGIRLSRKLMAEAHLSAADQLYRIIFLQYNMGFYQK